MKNITKFALAALLTTVAAGNVDAANRYAALAAGLKDGSIVAPIRVAPVAPAAPVRVAPAAPIVVPPAPGPVDPVTALTNAGKIKANFNAPAGDEYITTQAGKALLDQAVIDATTNANNAKDALVKNGTAVSFDAHGTATFDVDGAQTLIKKAEADPLLQQEIVNAYAAAVSATKTTLKDSLSFALMGDASNPGAVIHPASDFLNALRALPITTQAELDTVFNNHLTYYADGGTPLDLVRNTLVAALLVAAGDATDTANNINGKQVAIHDILGVDNNNIKLMDAHGAPVTKSLTEWLLDGII